ncbi:Ulp1 protease family protein [Metarhizium album ARSEF 1941]|uniref:Ulp1 protease family protein n=1 Tax=Metarhizium album (strain ARSEF 1941) TaxID=1081103 RepID=A0A0B2WYU1_METAS|nr:Ulp1 protease family protein [Metarhizium album ARSEF 1941]KHO01452.1 Ulp1 protease family protein [Metarhizium album ARSEF 1941]
MPQANKRSRPLNYADLSSPHIKRAKFAPRESIESEDELCRDTADAPRKRTNFSALCSPKRHLFSRRDIPHTQFTNHPKSHHIMTLPTLHASIPDLNVRRAVSGKHFYLGDDDKRGQLILQQHGNSTTLVPKFPADENPPLQWMRVPLDSITSIEHAMGSSHYVRMLRPRGNEFEANLWLQFTNHRDVFSLMQVASHVKISSCPPGELEVRWQKALDLATTYSAQNAKRTSNSGASRMQTSSSHATTNLPWRTDAQKESPCGSRPGGIIAKLRESALVEQSQATGSTKVNDDVVVSRAPTTRQTRRSSVACVTREPSPNRWTDENPGWRKSWHKSLIFPPAGKNRAIVDDDDILRLDEGEFLNDNLISFYVRYLQFKLESERPELLSKVYIFSTFFFEKLRSVKGKVNYDGVRSWTAKFDLLSYDYIVVPVNENAHWYLAIICNTPNAVSGMPKDDGISKKEEEENTTPPGITMIAQNMSDISIHSDDGISAFFEEPVDLKPPASSTTLQESSPPSKNATPNKLAAGPHVDPRLPRIVTLDSLGSPHAVTCRVLKEYLVAEAKDKKGVELAIIPTGMTAKRIPEQNNFCDCGVFILGYMQEFLKDPDETVRRLFQKEPVNWDIRPSLLRNQVRDLLFKLQEEQQERLESEKTEKRLLSAKKKKQVAAARAADEPASSPTTVREKLLRRQSGSLATVAGTPVGAGSCIGESDATGSLPMTQLSVDDDEVKLVDLPNDNPSTSNTSADDVFYSARTSPSRSSANSADKAKPNEPGTKPASSSHRTLDGYLTRRLTSSSCDVDVQRAITPEKQQRATTETVHAEDVVLISPNVATRQKPKPKPLESSPTFVKLLQSSPGSSPMRSKARYDGIERAVDLT